MAEIEKVVSILRQQCLWEIHGFDEVGSTMTEARRLAEAGAPSLTVVLADRQTAGRGRYDRIWSSASGEGLWMTALVRPHILPEQAPWFTLGAAVAVAESLVAFGYPAGIKWPNDVEERRHVEVGCFRFCAVALRLVHGEAHDVSLGHGFHCRQ